jgi:hypothetical protein
MRRKKIVTIGSARGITLPKQWLNEMKNKYNGQELKEVILSEVGDGYYISPIVPIPTKGDAK